MYLESAPPRKFTRSQAVTLWPSVYGVGISKRNLLYYLSAVKHN